MQHQRSFKHEGRGGGVLTALQAPFGGERCRVLFVLFCTTPYTLQPPPLLLLLLGTQPDLACFRITQPQVVQVDIDNARYVGIHLCLGAANATVATCVGYALLKMAFEWNTRSEHLFFAPGSVVQVRQAAAGCQAYWRWQGL